MFVCVCKLNEGGAGVAEYEVQANRLSHRACQDIDIEV
jgi:hypothetical protein